MEAVQKFGPNVIRFQLATGERQWYIVGCYLAPNDTLTIEIFIAGLKERPWGAKLLVTGDFNVLLYGIFLDLHKSYDALERYR